jgi:hypothetical protein
VDFFRGINQRCRRKSLTLFAEAKKELWPPRQTIMCPAAPPHKTRLLARRACLKKGRFSEAAFPVLAPKAGRQGGLPPLSDSADSRRRFGLPRAKVRCGEITTTRTLPPRVTLAGEECPAFTHTLALGRLLLRKRAIVSGPASLGRQLGRAWPRLRRRTSSESMSRFARNPSVPALARRTGTEVRRAVGLAPDQIRASSPPALARDPHTRCSRCRRLP